MAKSNEKIPASRKPLKIALQHPIAVLPLRAGNLHGKESLVDCTLVACEAKHPAASFAIKIVPATLIGTLLTLSVC